MAAAVLAGYLTARGLGPTTIGAVVTVTLLGSAALVIGTGLRPERFTPPRVAVATAGLMIVVGVAFAARAPIPLLVSLCLIGPLNPGGGDVSAFLPAEQAMLAGAVPPEGRTRVFARFTLVASVGAAIGGYSAGVPAWLDTHRGWTTLDAAASVFWVYAAIGVIVAAIYLRWVRRDAPAGSPAANPTRLGPSRRTVYELTALFGLDSAAGGLVLTSLIGLWLNRRFGFDLAAVGSTLATMALCSAASALAAPRLVDRFGPIRTMAFTHAPAGVLLCVIPFAPSAPVAVGLLLARALTSNLDVPARTAFVMNVVTPPERAAAAAFTNVPRALAAAITPLAAGWMLHRSDFGWPLLFGGLLKLLYDGLLLIRFGHLDATMRQPRAYRATHAGVGRPDQ